MTQTSDTSIKSPGDSQRPSTSDSMDSKTPSGSAMLAQQLGSEHSWADRYVPSTPSESIMTPGTSVADHSEHEYTTPNEAPPSYEEVTSSHGSSQAPSYARDVALPSTQAQPQTQSQSLPRPQLPGRHYSRHETSQSIGGVFTVYDSLELTTKSGSINIKLDVQPGLEPARVSLKTSSGSININDQQCDSAMSGGLPRVVGNSTSGGLLSFIWGSRGGASSSCSNSGAGNDNTAPQIDRPPIPTSDDPRKQPAQHLQQQQREVTDPNTSSTAGYRVVHTTIETGSGSVHGQLLLTRNSITSINTGSGSIHLRLITVDPSTPSSSLPTLDKLSLEDTRNIQNAVDYPSCTLSTSSTSGTQHITIATGAKDTSNGAFISSINASHHAKGSATLYCDYPRDWRGLVHASVGGSGHVNVRGDGLKFDRRGNKEVWGWRGENGGDGEGALERAVRVRGDSSGSVNFVC